MIGACFLLATLLVLTEGGSYKVSEVEVVAIEDGGLRASICAGDKITSFKFFAQVLFQNGTKRELKSETNTTGGKHMTVESEKISIDYDDKINYWVLVVNNEVGYIKQGVHTVKDHVSSSQSPNIFCERLACSSSITVQNGENACSNTLIFSEYFHKNLIDDAVWKVEKRLAFNYMENEFVSYQEVAIAVENSLLQITPKMLYEVSNIQEDDIDDGKLEIADCTEEEPKYCESDTDITRNVLPAVVSGRIKTKHFSFKYGKVEIRAKFPLGDWVYPTLYLEPKSEKQVSGGAPEVIRIAFARGNRNLQNLSEIFDSTVLSAGPLLARFEPCRYKYIVKNPTTEPLGSKFHIYGLIWKNDEMIFLLDGKIYSRIPTSVGLVRFDENCNEIEQNQMKNIFDKEYLLSIGVGMGGVSDFPDNLGNKPWKNKERNYQEKLWSDRANWLKTWNNETKMLVDWIRIWSI